MTLADTSVWADHFRYGNPRLRELLEAGEVCMHPMILGELACGSLPQREFTLQLLQDLPTAPEVTDEIVMQTIERRGLWGRGIGWVDAQLLCAALVFGASLWTLDRSLALLAAL